MHVKEYVIKLISNIQLSLFKITIFTHTNITKNRKHFVFKIQTYINYIFDM